MGDWVGGRTSRRCSPSGRRVTVGRIGGGVNRGAPGRCWPTPPEGRSPCGACWGRTGGVGSGRGPPGVMVGRIGGYEGRCGAGRVVVPPGPLGLARLPVAGGSGAVGRGGTTLSDGRRRGAAGRVGIAGTAEVPGAFGSSILNLMLGGTTRPTGTGLAGAGGATAIGAGGSSTTGGGGASTCGGTSDKLFHDGWRRWFLNRFFGHRRCWDRRRCWLGCLHQTRRSKGRGGGLRGLALLRRWRGLLDTALDRRSFGEHVTAGQRNAAIACETLDELSCDDFLDCARRALQFDSVRSLQQRQHFLAARVKKLCDLVDTNSCQIVLP
jgi:hypothetical protein